MQEILFHTATENDVSEMRTLLEEHGPNKWNYLPEEYVTKEFKDVVEGKAIALIAEFDNQIVGFAVIYPEFIRFPEYTDSEILKENIGYISDVVVHKEHVGKGIGTNLIENTKITVSKYGITEIYIDCHEENTASRGMARKAHFEEIALYLDVERRTVGSCKTWVGRFCSINGV
jgi:GNAT superfamily N-acetyltransferase